MYAPDTIILLYARILYFKNNNKNITVNFANTIARV